MKGCACTGFLQTDCRLTTWTKSLLASDKESRYAVLVDQSSKSCVVLQTRNLVLSAPASISLPPAAAAGWYLDQLSIGARQALKARESSVPEYASAPGICGRTRQCRSLLPGICTCSRDTHALLEDASAHGLQCQPSLRVRADHGMNVAPELLIHGKVVAHSRSWRPHFDRFLST